MITPHFDQMPSTVHNVHSVSVTLENVGGENTVSFLPFALRTRPKLCFRCTIHENFINFRGFGTVFSLFAQCSAIFAIKARKTDCCCDICKALPIFTITKRGMTKSAAFLQKSALRLSKNSVFRQRNRFLPKAFGFRAAGNTENSPETGRSVAANESPQPE